MKVPYMPNSHFADKIEAIIKLIKAEAKSNRNAVGMNGEWNDRGAERMEDQVRFFQYGLSGVLPPDWHKYEREVERNTDPEYAEYKRLQEKFGK